MGRRWIQTRGRRNKARAKLLAQQHQVEKGTLCSVLRRIKQQKRQLMQDRLDEV